MLIASSILARGNDPDLVGTLIYVAIFVAVGIISAVARWIQARAEKRRLEEAQQRAEGRRYPSIPPAPRQRASRQPYAPQPFPPQAPRRSQQTPPPVGPVLRPTQDEGPGRTMAEEVEAFGNREQEIQRREDEMELRRQRKLAQARKAAQPGHPQPRTAAPIDVAPEMRIHPAAEAAAALLGRLDADKLRQAVIYRELLSPPKALRNEPESWEL
jgi:HAMP domain-containing protein